MYAHNNHYTARQPLAERVKYKAYRAPKKVQIAEYTNSPHETFKRITWAVKDSQENAEYAYEVRDLALSILRNSGYNDGMDLSHDQKIAAIYSWFLENVSYVNDPYFNELIHRADTLVHQYNEKGYIAGDCDDFTILACALLLSVGVPCRARMIKTRSPVSGHYNWAHIYPMAMLENGQWVALDATEKDRHFGWEPPEGQQANLRKDWTFW